MPGSRAIYIAINLTLIQIIAKQALNLMSEKISRTDMSDITAKIDDVTGHRRMRRYRKSGWMRNLVQEKQHQVLLSHLL